jgi:hypothetical protein
MMAEYPKATRLEARGSRVLIQHQFPCNRQKYILAHESPITVTILLRIHFYHPQNNPLSPCSNPKGCAHGPARLPVLSAMANSHERLRYVTASSALPTALALATSAWVWSSVGYTNERGDILRHLLLAKSDRKMIVSR